MCYKVIEEKSIGEAWKSSVKAVMENGGEAMDGDIKIRELLNLHISVKNPKEDDNIINCLGDEKMIIWMKENFFSKDPVENWGYSYGQRIQDYDGINQYEKVKQKLLKNIESKSATIILSNPQKDISHNPCICVMDFKVRNNILILNAFFRSQDICKKMYVDALCLTTIMNNMSKELKVKETYLNLYIMSAHIYEDDFRRSEKIAYARVN